MVADWAVPSHELLETVGTLVDSDEAGTLITVLDVEGSAYRRPGAKMVITADGSQIGSVTAGCLESRFVEIARAVVDTETPRVETFDLTGEDDTWGLGVGCNGVITFLFEPLTPAYAPVSDAISADEPFALVATVDEHDQLAGRGVYTDGAGFVPVIGDVPPARVDQLRPHLRDAMREGATEYRECDSDDVFVDGVASPPRLLILGHGNDVGPVVELGRKNGFRVEVGAFRGASNAAARFEDAHAVHTVSPADVTDALALDKDTYVVIMSHNFVDDTLALQSVLDSSVPYIGLLGPRKRFDEMLADLGGEAQLSDADRDRIYTPIGIDLGGETPYQIAHSILAEVLAVHNGRDVTHLADREGPIHER